MPNDYFPYRDCLPPHKCCGHSCRRNPCPPKGYLCPCMDSAGDIGPTGPQGIQGPRGIPGNLGPVGPMGVTGPTGPDGLAATISIEDSTGVPFDNSPYVINVGTPHAAIFRFGIPAGTPGIPGVQGPTGEEGKSAYRIAVDHGYVGTETEWLDGLQGETGPAGPEGLQGETGPTGPLGIQGETGPTGPRAAMIPFSISKYGTSLSTDKNGDPLMITFSGFSPAYAATIYLQEGEWDSGYVRVREDTPYPTSFVMTYNGTLKKFYVLFSSHYGEQIEAGIIIRPFACLAISTTDELIYKILPETIVYADPYEGGTAYPTHTIRKGSRTDLNVAIPEGALVAIVSGITATTGERYATLSISGGLYLE